MGRPRQVDDEALVERLSAVFRDVGYAAASAERLGAATGLKPSSLYHRYPGGKQQMAAEVLAAASAWFGEHVLAPIAGPGTPAEAVAAVRAALDRFYAGGRKACLLNLLAQPPEKDSPFADAIAGMFGALIGAFASLAERAGCPPDEATARATRAVALLHGSLVLARGLCSPAPFQLFLHDLDGELGLR